MNYSLPRITCLGWLLLCTPLAATEAVPSEPLAPSGQQLVRRSASMVAQQDALAAKFRQRASLFGVQIGGSGSYQQVRVQGRTMLRLELALQAGELITLLQISDGVTLWTRRDEGDSRTISYVDLRRLREIARDSGAADAALVGADALASGGLPQMLHGLDANFEFEAAQPANIGPVPVWNVRGHWKRAKLAALLPEVAGDQGDDQPLPLDRLPPHLPHTVTLSLGRDDFLPLFPYRIEYARQQTRDATDDEPGVSVPAEAASQPMLTIELFEVTRTLKYDPRQFFYELSDQHVEDRTDWYLDRLGLRDEDTRD